MLSMKTDNILEDLYLLRIFSKGVGWVMLDVSPRFRNCVPEASKSCSHCGNSKGGVGRDHC